MNAKQIVENLQNHKGQHVQACWTRPMKTRKDVPMSIVKRTCAYVRAGIDYANLRTVKEGVESGERAEVQGLKWGQWSEFPFIIAHKGVDYVRLYPAVFANLKPTVEYSIDGKPATGGSGLNSSRIYCLLTCWMMLAMSGQRRYNRVQLPLINAKSKPSFKADLTLNLFRGSEDGETLGDGAIYLIKDCWISDLQIMECDHSRTGDHASITATIQAGAVVPRPL
jgi:hypothetical protein